MFSPLDLHLCQPDSLKSCGACCGLYNYADSRRESLISRLRQRTALYQSIPKTREGLDLFAKIVLEREDNEKRYEVIYCCEYLGFIDAEERKVGCLLHPEQNQGRDLREVSFYGRELCAGHFCPSYHYLTGEEKKSIINILDDWYLYGLVITDIDLVKTYFRLISNILGETPSADIFKEATFKKIAQDFFYLKINWPFRSADVHRFGKYYFDGSQYMINHIDYEKFGRRRSPYDSIFLSLTSVFEKGEEIEEAEKTIGKHIERFISTYNKRSNPYWKEAIQ